MKLLLDLSLPEYSGKQCIYFWGHQGNNPKTCMSQWHDSRFIVDNVEYATAEHWMMAKKAELFGDVRMAKLIASSTDPREVKAMGRKVKNFSADLWDQYKYQIVVEGNIAKFKQNPDLSKYLLSTGNAILVEASPYDVVWGIGLNENDARKVSYKSWKGENLLGFALMDVRSELRNMK